MSIGSYIKSSACNLVASVTAFISFADIETVLGIFLLLISIASQGYNFYIIYRHNKKQKKLQNHEQNS